MIDHQFTLLPHHFLGPIRNQWGWTFYIAEIGDAWLLRWTRPFDRTTYSSYHPSHNGVIVAIRKLYQDGANAQ